MKRKTKDGKEIDIKDMETSHIINCIKLIKKRWIYVREVYCYGYWEHDYIEWDVEEYRDEGKERKYLIAFYEELLERQGIVLD